MTIGGHAQSYSNNFENGYTWYPPWSNLRLVADSTEAGINHVCLCDSIHEYGLGFSFEAGKIYPRQNVNCQYQLMFKAQPETQAEIVFTIDEGNKKYWQAYPLADFVNDTTEWSQMRLDLNFPFDYIGEGKVKSYIWNQGRERLVFDDAQLEVKTDVLPSYQPIVEFNADSLFNTDYYPQISDFIPIVEYINADGDTLTDPSVMDTKFMYSWIDYYGEPHSSIIADIIQTETTFKEDIKLLRLAYVLPLPDGELTVYRRNHHIDTTNYQSSYYLDREGFAIKNDSISISTYHNLGISSLQLNTEDRTACFNIDYWRDHPLLHYPLRNDTSDMFENISFRLIKKGDVLKDMQSAVSICRSASFRLCLLFSASSSLPCLICRCSALAAPSTCWSSI